MKGGRNAKENFANMRFVIPKVHKSICQSFSSLKEGGVMEKAQIKVMNQQNESEKFSTLPAFGSTRIHPSIYDRGQTENTHFENGDRKILKAGTGIGGGGFMKPQSMKGSLTFHGKLLDKENNQEVNLERYSNTLYIRVVKGLKKKLKQFESDIIEEREREQQEQLRLKPYMAPGGSSQYQR